MSAVGCLILALAAIVGAVLLFGNGFAGPAPIALAGAGGLIAAANALWHPPRPRLPPPPDYRGRR